MSDPGDQGPRIPDARALFSDYGTLLGKLAQISLKSLLLLPCKASHLESNQQTETLTGGSVNIVKIFGKTMALGGGLALALGFTLIGPTTQAQASVAFRVQSVTTGKCLQWNGINKAVTLAACKHAWAQIWSPEGIQLANDTNEYGAWCLDDPSTKEKAPTGRACANSGFVNMNDKRVGHTTYMASRGGYFKTVNGKAMWGKRTSALKDMRWKLIST